MGKYDDVELQGTERERTLAAIERQMLAWGISMPRVEPLVVDFGLGRFREIGETEFWIANEETHGYCGKFLFLFDGQTCPRHHHKSKHETFFMVKGRIRMLSDPAARTMDEGDVLPMPPDTWHSFTGIGPALVLEVSTPSLLQDNFFEDTAIGRNGVV